MARAVPGVILAAGASSRLGEPKSLVDIEDSPLVWWAYEHLKNAGCEPIVVVTRAELSVDVLLAVPDAIVSINAHPETGRTGSLQNGISSLDAPVCPIHQGRKGHPVVLSTADLERILSASSTTPLRDIVSFQEVPVDGPWLHLNIDTPESLRNLHEEATELHAYFQQ